MNIKAVALLLALTTCIVGDARAEVMRSAKGEAGITAIQQAAASFSTSVRSSIDHTISLGRGPRSTLSSTTGATPSMFAQQHRSWMAKDNRGRDVEVDVHITRSIELRGGAHPTFARTRVFATGAQTGGLHNTSEEIHTERRLPFGLRYRTSSVRYTNGVGAQVSFASNKTRQLRFEGRGASR
ncbi:MAG: hypothetical protein ABI321_21730 [Polyangia bacterium]